jgi:hypothetical protein
MTDGYWTEVIPDGVFHLLVCDGQGEWSALYVNGRLDKIGDHYLIDERIRELAGVITLQTDDFFRGGNSRDEAAQDLDDLRQYRQAREFREQQIAKLRAQADQLLQKAVELEETP